MKLEIKSVLFSVAVLLLVVNVGTPRVVEEGKVEEERRPALQYAVKFVCGESAGDVVPRGTYFTAINVHNPNAKPVGFRKKFAIALPEEKPGPVSRFFGAKLGPDQAFEIDCKDIFGRTQAKGRFLKGFAVIESDMELDVVAVYTAAGIPHVETLETRRVLPRHRKEPEVVVGPDDHCPPGRIGDPVGGEGCCCNIPFVRNPAGPGDFWPDCAPNFECRGNTAGPGIPTSTFAVCTPRGAPPNVLADLHWSQPKYCRK